MVWLFDRLSAAALRLPCLTVYVDGLIVLEKLPGWLAIGGLLLEIGHSLRLLLVVLDGGESTCGGLSLLLIAEQTASVVELIFVFFLLHVGRLRRLVGARTRLLGVFLRPREVGNLVVFSLVRRAWG